MVTSELGSCEWFVWDLRRSGLIDRGQLDQVVGDYLKNAPRAEPPALAEFLVAQNILSPFQADRVLQGKTQGLVLGPYVLIDSIGSGSMGQVFKALSKTDNQHYAVKVLPRRSMWNVRLARRQVRAFGQFNHPAVVPFIDVGTAGGQHYLVWPLVEGETLETRVQREGKLSPEATATILMQVAQGLASAHQQGLFHGLLKPSNIMLGRDGQARILDFGIGSLLVENEGESLVDTMSTANTLTSGLDCASPESIMEPTNRTQAGDQYSFGCILYFCLAGRYPFADGTAVEKMMAHQFKQPSPIRETVANIPEPVSDLLERVMQKSPEKRFASIDEIVETLQPFATEQGARRGSHFGGSKYGSQFGTGRVSVSSSRTNSGSPSPSHFGTNPTSSPAGKSGLNGRRLPVCPTPPAQPALQSGRPTTATPNAIGVAGDPTKLVAALRPGSATDDRNLPVAQAVETPPPSANQTAAQPAIPGWFDVEKTRGVSVFSMFVIVAIVMAGVYIVGKSYVFGG